MWTKPEIVISTGLGVVAILVTVSLAQVSRVDTAFSQIAETNVKMVGVATDLSHLRDRANDLASAAGQMADAASSMKADLAAVATELKGIKEIAVASQVAVSSLDKRLFAMETTLSRIDERLAAGVPQKKPIFFEVKDGDVFWGSLKEAGLRGDFYIGAEDPKTQAVLEKLIKQSGN